MILKPILKVISYVNIVFLTALTFVTVIDVVARYVFNTSLIDAMTISSYLLACITALALAEITYKNGHIKTEILYDRLPPNLKTFFYSMNNFIASILFFVMAWFSYAKAVKSFKRGIYQGWMHIPEYPTKFIFAFGLLLTGLTFLLLFINIFINKKEPSKGGK
jgi:TRAP-type C4-dicarboxylate transport system permease small subunit